MSTANSEPVFRGGGHVRTLTIRRSAQARRMRIAVDPRDGMVRLTIPGRAALGPALKWAESKRPWIESVLARVPAAQPFRHGTTFPFEGTPVTIVWDAAHPRTVLLAADRLIVGGPEEMVGGRVLRWLKAEALKRLDGETRAIAAHGGIVIGRVRVGDARTRWGSCSSGGDIAYSWRLILAPPVVREAIVAHEVAHRLHMHHGPEFHAAATRLLGRDGKAERAWLRAHGAGLHAIGAG